MPPNPPSNSRLPQLAVWSGYGTANDRSGKDGARLLPAIGQFVTVRDDCDWWAIVFS